MSLGPAEILVIVVIALLVFGPHKLPEVGRQVGRTMREFRRFQQVMSRDLHEVFGQDDAAGTARTESTAPAAPPSPDQAAPPSTGDQGSGAATETRTPRPETDETDG